MKTDTTWSNYMNLKKAKSKKKSARRKPTRAKSKLKLLNLKADRKDREALVALAKKYEKGNLSAWLRRAGLKYRPA